MQKLFESMRAAGVQPDEASYAFLLESYCIMGNSEKAASVLQTMRDNVLLRRLFPCLLYLSSMPPPSFHMHVTGSPVHCTVSRSRHPFSMLTLSFFRARDRPRGTMLFFSWSCTTLFAPCVLASLMHVGDHAVQCTLQSLRISTHSFLHPY